MTDRNIAAETIKEQKIQPTLFQIIKYKLS